MRLFHALVFDEVLRNGEGFLTDPKWNELLGRAESLTAFFCVSDVIDVDAPTVYCDALQSPDELNWSLRAHLLAGTAGEIIQTTDETLFAASDAFSPGSATRQAFTQLAVVQGGAETMRVRVWVTGRGKLLPPIGDVEIDAPDRSLRLPRFPSPLRGRI